jgi:hypothetical protein
MSNERILRACRFFALPNRELWVSTDLREAFSYEAVDGHDTPWLNQHLADRPPRKEFWFYFNNAPEKADEVCREVLAEIGLPELEPQVRLAGATSGAVFQRDLGKPFLRALRNHFTWS